MFNEKNMKRLTLILLALLIIGLGIKFKDKFSKNTSSSTNEIVAIKASNVQSISFFPKENGEKFQIVRQDNYWLIKTGDIKVQADAYTVHELLLQLELLKPKELVTKSKKEWEKYEVTEALGTRIVINEGKKPLADIILGNFLFDKKTNKITSYVRNTNEKQVYAVDGYLSMMFTRGAKSFRDNSVLLGNPEQWNKLTFKYPADSSFTLSRINNTWSCESKTCNNVKVEEFFSKVRMLTTTKFEDSIVIASDKAADYQLTIEGTNFEPIIIEGFFIDNILITKSSINKKNLFNSSKIKRVLFVNKEEFIIK